jgi:2-polyprenyl-3-methyl-5-hydroxy-6-metoxy-1,4-benzoquinol methylase
MNLLTKSVSYYSSPRTEIDSLLPHSVSNILDVGAGCGTALVRIQSLYPSSIITGIDNSKTAIDNGKLDTQSLIIHDLNEGLPSRLPCSSYDLVLCLDVLEHLIQPDKLLNDIRPIISNNGCIIVSLPNLRYWQICYDLVVNGDFIYKNQGIMDYTHVRWFTHRSAIRMFIETGFTVDSFKLHPGRVAGKKALLNLFPFLFVKEMLSWQLLYRLRLR